MWKLTGNVPDATSIFCFYSLWFKLRVCDRLLRLFQYNIATAGTTLGPTLRLSSSRKACGEELAKWSTCFLKPKAHVPVGTGAKIMFSTFRVQNTLESYFRQMKNSPAEFTLRVLCTVKTIFSRRWHHQTEGQTGRPIAAIKKREGERLSQAGKSREGEREREREGEREREMKQGPLR